MKDIKTVKGNRFESTDTINPGDEVIAVTVRNKSANGRRLGIFSKNNNIVLGQQIHQGDALHTPLDIAELPVGYNSGKEVNLSPKRDYQKIFNFTGVHLIKNWTIGNDELFQLPVDFDLDNPKLSTEIKDLSKTRTSVQSGNMQVGTDGMVNNLNRFVSFSFVLSGQPYHIGLDFGKHPALTTAELNHRLNRIHPNLRGFVSIENKDDLMVDYGIYFNAPDNLDIIFPLTTFPTREDLCDSDQFGPEIYEKFETVHLNKLLTNALLLNRNGVANTTNTITTVTGETISNISDMVANPFVVDMTSYSHPPETPTTYTGRVNIPANAFKTWDEDHRLSFAVIKLKRNFVAGRIFKFNSIRYVDDLNNPLDYENSLADLLVVPSFVYDQGNQSDSVPGIFLRELASEDSGDFEAYVSGLANEIEFAEAGNVNDADLGAYLVLFPRPTNDSRNSIFFRQTNLSTRLEISYELVDADTIPTLKMNDIGLVDYHAVTQVEAGFVPLSFNASVATSWGLDFIADGQTDRFEGTTFEDGDGNEVNILTNGTIALTELVASLNFSQVQAPNGTFNQYHLNRQLGCQSWLTKNLLPIGTVINRPITAVKSNYTVGFPDVDLPDSEINDFDEEGLILGQTDGSLEVGGYFANDEMDVLYPGKSVLLHGTNPVWDFTINGASVPPIEAVAFEAASGGWSTHFSLANLVAVGAGIHTFRASLTVKYPWLSATTNYSETIQYEVLSPVEGVEDDVSFITTELYDTNTNTPVEGQLRLIDLDSNEILAEGNTIAELEADASSKGLVDIEFVYGDPSEVAEPNDCEPTSLDFIPSVAFNNSSETFVLNFKIDVDGEIQTGQILAEGEIVDLLGGGIQAENLAEYLFLYGLNDLMRPDRHNMNAYFNYTPFSDGYDLVAGQHITISGLPSTYSDENYIVEPKSVTLSLVLAENLESGQRDYVSEQFGHEISIHSCIHRTAI